MKKCSETTADITIGLDLGDKKSHFHVVDDSGETLEEGKLPTTPKALSRYFSGVERARVVIETGTHSPWVDELVRKCGHESMVANARKLRLISENDRKSDKADAELLARLGRADPKLLSPIQHRGSKARLALSRLRARDALVSTRTKLINHVRGAVKPTGSRITGCSTGAFSQKALEQIPEDLRPALTPLLELIGSLSEKIKEFDKSIARMCKKVFPETERLRRVRGVGPLTALAYVLILEDPQRFQKSRAVGAYLGMVPKRDDSGEDKPHLRITKAGDCLLRRLLVGSAQYLLGPFGEDSDLRRHGELISQRGGKIAKKRAVVAVARKLAVLLHRLWVSGEEYEPLRNSVRQEKTQRRKMHVPERRAQ